MFGCNPQKTMQVIPTFASTHITNFSQTQPTWCILSNKCNKIYHNPTPHSAYCHKHITFFTPTQPTWCILSHTYNIIYPIQTTKVHTVTHMCNKSNDKKMYNKYLYNRWKNKCTLNCKWSSSGLLECLTM